MALDLNEAELLVQVACFRLYQEGLQRGSHFQVYNSLFMVYDVFLPH